MKHCKYILIFFVILACNSSYQRDGQHEKQAKQWDSLLKAQNHILLVDTLSAAYYDINTDQQTKDLAICYLINSHYLTNSVDSLSKFIKLSGVAKGEENKSIYSYEEMMGLYSISAIYYITSKLDYRTALDLFLKAYDLSKHQKDTNNTCKMLVNISSVYSMRKDTTGLKYAQEAYSLSILGDEEINDKCLGALSLAKMLLLYRDYDKALELTQYYIDRVQDLELTAYMKIALNSYHADVLYQQGRREEALKYYEEAVRNITEPYNSISIKTLTYYAQCLLELSMHKQAIGQFNKALELSTQLKNIEFKHQIYLGLSLAYEQLNNLGESLHYYKQYDRALAEYYDINKENEIRNLMLENERIKYSMEIANKDRNIFVALSFVLIFIVISVFSILLYLHRNSMYVQLVQKYEQYRKSLNEKKKIEEERASNRNSEMLLIYEKVEEIMKQEKLYHDKNLSVNSLSTIIGTNTTYLSNVINNYSNKSVPNYINSYRLKELISLLSDQDREDDQIFNLAESVGFSSKATFNRFFKKEVGCTPTFYKKELKNLENSTELE